MLICLWKQIIHSSPVENLSFYFQSNNLIFIIHKRLGRNSRFLDTIIDCEILFFRSNSIRIWITKKKKIKPKYRKRTKEDIFLWINSKSVFLVYYPKEKWAIVWNCQQKIGAALLSISYFLAIIFVIFTINLDLLLGWEKSARVW